MRIFLLFIEKAKLLTTNGLAFFIKVNFKQKVDKIEDFITLTLRSLRLCVNKNNCRRQLKSQSGNCCMSFDLTIFKKLSNLRASNQMPY